MNTRSKDKGNKINELQLQLPPINHKWSRSKRNKKDKDDKQEKLKVKKFI